MKIIVEASGISIEMESDLMMKGEPLPPQDVAAIFAVYSERATQYLSKAAAQLFKEVIEARDGKLEVHP